jgi:hypothetical protein
MTEFQALITGAVAGALQKASPSPFNIDVAVPTDSEGNYRYEVWVTGNESGEELVIKIEPRYDTPESVEEKMQGVHAMREAAARHGIELG